MKDINIKKLFKNRNRINATIFLVLVSVIYLLISVYFSNHFFFNTVINGVNVSLKAHDEVDNIIKNYINNYELLLIERRGETEKIVGRDIKIQYNEKNSVYKVYNMQNSLKWIGSLLKGEKHYVDDLFVYNKNSLKNKIDELNCLSKDMVEPKNVSFKYSEGSYNAIEEVYGNKVNKDKLDEAIQISISRGEAKLDLNERHCYENPKYTLSSSKTSKTKDLLNKYVKAKVTYIFGNENEMLDGNIINEWLTVDENLDVSINKISAMKYIQGLCKKYDTVGVARNFKTSTGKVVEVKDGLYGWKINFDAEVKALLEYLKLGEVIEKEPEYIQKAVSRNGNEIGGTYVEINITRQHLWFYKDGKLITQGYVVTGNPSRGHSTVVGTYMLNYKQKGATLTGPGYEAPVTYWMPFYGNIGIHDASWRYSFGGEIYKRNGSHGCVNAPLNLAKTIFENIEEGTPIICYEE